MRKRSDKVEGIEDRFLKALKKQSKTELIALIQKIVGQLTPGDREDLLGTQVREKTPKAISPADLLQETVEFHKDSLKGAYYAPFSVDSKNYTHIPEETDLWCSKFARLADDAVVIKEHRDQPAVAKIFQLLEELLEAVNNGDEIFFADEAGTWMIPVDEKKFASAYVQVLAKVTDEEGFSEAVMPILQRDSFQSFSMDFYSTVRAVATKEQMQRVDREMEIRKVGRKGQKRSQK